jgi:hypothetical protein
MTTTSKPRIATVLAIALCTLPVSAKRAEHQSFMPAAYAPALAGKTLALALHEPPEHQRLTKGSAWTFILLGSAAATGTAEHEGKEFAEKSGVEDPAVIARDLVAATLRDAYRMQPQAADAKPAPNPRPKTVAEMHSDADYVLSVDAVRTQHGGAVGVGIWLNFQLVNVSTGKPIAYLHCEKVAGKRDGEVPDIASLEADDGRLVKSTLATFAALCARQFLAERMAVPQAQLAALPPPGHDPYVPWVAPAGE